MNDLQEFALFVLETLEDDRAWNPDTLERIQDEAYRLDLANTDMDGFFAILPKGERK